MILEWGDQKPKVGGCLGVCSAEIEHKRGRESDLDLVCVLVSERELYIESLSVIVQRVSCYLDIRQK